MSYLYEGQVVIMYAYKMVSMHVSKKCYICMSSCIDETLQFSTSLRHIIVTLFLVVNTLSISFYFSYISLFIFIFNDPKNLNQNKAFFFVPFFLSNFSSYLLIIMGSISEQEYVCVLAYLEYLITKFMARKQEKSKASQ